MGIFDAFNDATKSGNHSSPFGEAGLALDPLAHILGDKYKKFMRKTWEIPNKELSPYVKKFNKFDRKINPMHKAIDKTQFGEDARNMVENKPGDSALAILGAVFGGGALMGGGAGGGAGSGGFSGYGQMGGFQPSSGSNLGVFSNGGVNGMQGVGGGNMGNLVGQSSAAPAGSSWQDMLRQQQGGQQQQQQQQQMPAPRKLSYALPPPFGVGDRAPSLSYRRYSMPRQLMRV